MDFAWDFAKDWRWDLGRRTARERDGGYDPSVMELLPLASLKAHAVFAGMGMNSAPRRERGRKRLAQAQAYRELARRTGEVETLKRAARAAGEAAGEAETDKRLLAAARLEQAEAVLLAGDLYDEPDALPAAEGWLDLAETAAQKSPDLLLRVSVLRARTLTRRALGSEFSGLLDAAEAALDTALTGLGRDPALPILAARGALACERFELRLARAVRAKDRVAVTHLVDDIGRLAEQIDPDYLPLSWARAESLRGQALAAEGDLSGEAARIADGAAALAAAAEAAPVDHSPLDRARISHALAHAMQSLGEACDEDSLFDHALAAFDQAQAALVMTPELRLAGLAAYDRAAAEARRAERHGDLPALARAETAFKRRLAENSRAPVAWAVAQMALARIYEIRAGLTGDRSERVVAALALDEAKSVFAERGLKILTEQADAGLARAREGWA